MDKSTLNKFQQQFWVTKQTVFRKLGKKEDDCIVASDANLDAKLELFKSIRCTSSAMNKLLDRYQERICYLAQEQNAMGRFLKEYGKTDKSGAGKMMIQMGKSLIYCSQQEIGLRPPLLRLYQEVETFRSRAVEDTLDTIKQMERQRTEYRASLKWMKNVSQELDPDTYKQMEKFRKVQGHVKKSKGQFDKLKLACLQKVDLLAAARCNMFSHALIQYQHSTMTTTEKNARIFNTLASAFKGYQHYEFSVIKELKELVDPPSKVTEEGNKPQGAKDELLFDFGSEEEPVKKITATTDTDEELLDTTGSKPLGQRKNPKNLTNPGDKSAYENASLLLDDILGPLDQSPETESAQEALDLGLSWPTSSEKLKESNSHAGSHKNTGNSTEKQKGSGDLLTDDFDSLTFENESSDTMALLNELLNTSSSILQPDSQMLVPTKGDELIPENKNSQPTGRPGTSNSLTQKPTSSGANGNFLPSQLLDLGALDALENSGPDLLNFNGPPLNAPPLKLANKTQEQASSGVKSWYDIFADLDPISNPDAVGKKEPEENDNRYC